MTCGSWTGREDDHRSIGRQQQHRLHRRAPMMSRLVRDETMKVLYRGLPARAF
jgi:hypothetical protein